MKTIIVATSDILGFQPVVVKFLEGVPRVGEKVVFNKIKYPLQALSIELEEMYKGTPCRVKRVELYKGRTTQIIMLHLHCRNRKRKIIHRKK